MMSFVLPSKPITPHSRIGRRGVSIEETEEDCASLVDIDWGGPSIVDSSTPSY